MATGSSGSGASAPYSQHKPHNPFMCTGKKYFKMVAITVNGTNSTSFSFGSDEVLKNATILAIESFDQNDFAEGPLGQTMVNATVFAKAFLNLKAKENSEDVITRLPLARLRAANNSGEPFRCCELKINPTDCTIEVANTGSLAVGENFYIGIHFARK